MKKILLSSTLLIVFQIVILISTAWFLFHIKNSNYEIEQEIAYLQDKIDKSLAEINVHKTELTLITNPIALEKLAKIYLSKGRYFNISTTQLKHPQNLANYFSPKAYTNLSE